MSNGNRKTLAIQQIDLLTAIQFHYILNSGSVFTQGNLMSFQYAMLLAFVLALCIAPILALLFLSRARISKSQDQEQNSKPVSMCPYKLSPGWDDVNE
jgi:hypothetical protein